VARQSALGRIGTPEAAKALGAFSNSAPKALQIVIAEGLLTAAEQLAQNGKAKAASLSLGNEARAAA